MTGGRRNLATLAVLAVLVSASAVAAVGPVAGAGATIAGTDVDPDSVLLRVDVADDGTARWHVEYRVRLDDENRTAAFESVREDIAENPDEYRQQFADLMGRSVAKAENRTGREMTVQNVTVATERGGVPERGFVIYTFEWTRFATVEGETVRAGAAISGFYVDETSKLMVTWPEGYELRAATPEPDENRSGVVAWEGPTDFTADEPRLRLARATGGDGGGAESSSDGWPASLPVPVPMAAGAGAGLLVLLGGVGWVVVRGREDAGAGSAAVDDDGESAGADSGDERPPPELLSNEERVLVTLEEHGGRMKQQELADALDWKAPKTSKVVGDLRDEEAVDVFRLGRENVVTLPEYDLLSDDGGEER